MYKLLEDIHKLQCKLEGDNTTLHYIATGQGAAILATQNPTSDAVVCSHLTRPRFFVLLHMMLHLFAAL
jgi:hypothetical protein